MEIDWEETFAGHGSKNKGSKFERLPRPIPLCSDFKENVAAVVEYLWRAGRKHICEVNQTLFIPVKDNWFMVDEESYIGHFTHVCDPVGMLKNYTQYAVRFEQLQELRLNPTEMWEIEEAKEHCRNAIWKAHHCTGFNSYFREFDFYGAEMANDILQTLPKYKATDDLEFHSCNKCQSIMPKAIVVASKLQRSRLQGVLSG